MKLFWAILGILILGGFGFLWVRRNAPPELQG